jgi:hypothetical protein
MSSHRLFVTLLLFISLQEAYIRQEKQNAITEFATLTGMFLPSKFIDGVSYPLV